MPHPTGRPWIIAHRGASLQVRENTLAAFALARDLGADSVELDARRTADGAIIVHHDDTLAGADRPIVAMRRKQISEVAPWVPDLDDAIAACQGMWVDVEIKNDPREADWDPDDLVVAAVANAHASDEIVVTSFNVATIVAARTAGLRTGWLLGRGLDPAEMADPAAEAGHDYLLPHWSTLDGEHGRHVMEAATTAGIEVAVWTVDDADQMVRLADLGVGAVCSNAPDVAFSALGDHRNR